MASSTASKRVIKFSKLEELLIELLPRDGGKVDTPTLVEQYYGSMPEEAMPQNPQQTLISRLRGIGRKAERMNLSWRLKRSERAGPHPMSFWIEVVR